MVMCACTCVYAIRLILLLYIDKLPPNLKFSNLGICVNLWPAFKRQSYKKGLPVFHWPAKLQLHTIRVFTTWHRVCLLVALSNLTKLMTRSTYSHTFGLHIHTALCYCCLVPNRLGQCDYTGRRPPICFLTTIYLSLFVIVNTIIFLFVQLLIYCCIRVWKYMW